MSSQSSSKPCALGFSFAYDPLVVESSILDFPHIEQVLHRVDRLQFNETCLARLEDLRNHPVNVAGCLFRFVYEADSVAPSAGSPNRSRRVPSVKKSKL